MLMSLTAIMSKHLASGQAAQDELAFDESGVVRSSEFIAKRARVRRRVAGVRSGIQKTKPRLSETELANQ